MSLDSSIATHFIQNRANKVLSDHGLSISVFARQAGMEYQLVYQMLRKSKKPTMALLNALLLSCPRTEPLWLYTGQGPAYRQELPINEQLSNVIQEAEQELNDVTKEGQQLTTIKVRKAELIKALILMLEELQD